MSLHGEEPLVNRANPNLNIGLKSPQGDAPTDREKDTHVVKVFFSDSVMSYWQTIRAEKDKAWTQPINFSILYAVQTELNRHGIRSWFEKKTNYQAIILVPGIEPEHEGDKRWGVAIGTEQISSILQKLFEREVPFNIKVLAAFSTGIGGLNQTLLNELVPLNGVERLIIYDCLYETSSGSTAQALAALKSKAGSKLKIVVYKTSEEKANSFMPDKIRLSVPTKNPGLISGSGIIENLFQRPEYISLICFRALEGAEKDHVITIPIRLQTAFNDLKNVVPARGSIISNGPCFQYVYGSLPQSSSFTLFEDWVRRNEAALKAFYAFIGAPWVVETARDLLWNNKLPGWAGGLGAEKHDLLIPEFGWEYLPY
jgi:hypothetical protein